MIKLAQEEQLASSWSLNETEAVQWSIDVAEESEHKSASLAQGG